MSDKPGHSSSSEVPKRRGLRALYDWLVPAPPVAPDASDATIVVARTPVTRPGRSGAEAPMPARIGHYELTRKLGEGGMGIVYAARDARLERLVALKTMKGLSAAASPEDAEARKRFWREARSAASVNHPHICQIYEIGEEDGQPFIVMELLEGESLADRLKRGPLSAAQAVPMGLEMLSALSALHARGIVHRDLKPSNVFLATHGVKLLDFGLARAATNAFQDVEAGLTRPGISMGTPRYMAPEQVEGEETDHRSDLFAAGAILFEMLAGRPAFTGRSAIEILHATLHDQPPALIGSPAVAAVDRVIRRALAKRSSDRPASAEVMAGELRTIRGVGADDTPAQTHTLTRLVVLPFRVLKPDTETDFLAFSLPDAIATSLSGNASLVVRSSATAARFAGAAPDIKAIATEVDVDRVVVGTLLRSGDQLRAVAQLVDAPGGTLIASHTVQSSLGDLFGLQDDITQRVVEALSLPLTGSTATATDRPRDPRAYELYLRANEAGRAYEGVPAALDLYQQCIDLDSRFAPAWARLGRCHRVIGKYIDSSSTPESDARAEEAYKRALELNPRLGIAHKFYANLEADIGQPQRALVRLLGEATRHGNDPELFAGLVHACRYCGLLEDSVAAHEEARRLDPHIRTSVELTLLMTGDFERLLALPMPPAASGTAPGMRIMALGFAGRRAEARELVASMREIPKVALFRVWADYLLAWLDFRAEDVLTLSPKLSALGIYNDPEAIFQEGWMLCDAGEYERGLQRLRRSIDHGYWVVPTLSRAKQFDPVRDRPEFQAILATAETRRQEALAAFRAAGGERLFGG